jgi:small subunit ribosomal protein S16
VAVKIRLTRIGRKHAPYYRIVVTDAKEARDGKPIEVLGNYSPIANPPVWGLKPERVQYWISKGAQATPKVQSILRSTLKAEEAAKQ